MANRYKPCDNPTEDLGNYRAAAGIFVSLPDRPNGVPHTSSFNTGPAEYTKCTTDPHQDNGVTQI
jgi:hypothetical protein